MTWCQNFAFVAEGGQWGHYPEVMYGSGGDSTQEQNQRARLDQCLGGFTIHRGGRSGSTGKDHLPNRPLIHRNRSSGNLHSSGPWLPAPKPCRLALLRSCSGQFASELMSHCMSKPIS